MDINKTYNNSKLELRRQKLIKKQQADAALRESKRKAFDAQQEVAAALDGRVVGPLSAAIVRRLRNRAPGELVKIKPMKRLLQVVVDRSCLLKLDHYLVYLPILFAISRRRAWWVRSPEEWRPRTHNVAKQLFSLLRHLLTYYDVLAFFDRAWKGGSTVQQDWYLHVGRGYNLRTAAGLPITLTKKMAHHAMDAQEDMEVLQAIRYGQAMGMGVSQRHAQQIVASRIGSRFEDAAEPFWATVLNFFAQHPMIDPHQIGPVIDYLHHQKFQPAPPVWLNGAIVDPGPPQPGLSMHRRDPMALLHQVEAWHRGLARARRGESNLVWVPCGIAGYDRTEGEPPNQRRFQVMELLSAAELRTEGSAMHHCVATYASSCHARRTAIYSMTLVDREGQQRMLTIEVSVIDRKITQARGKLNKLPTPLTERILRGWATTASLGIAKYVIR